LDKLKYEHYAIILGVLERKQADLLSTIKEINKRKDVNIDTYENYVGEANSIKEVIEAVKNNMKGLK
jgi:hypothetical protein